MLGGKLFCLPSDLIIPESLLFLYNLINYYPIFNSNEKFLVTLCHIFYNIQEINFFEFINYSTFERTDKFIII